ncbi:ATP synthase F0 subunit B [bacterium]|nr:ATP synthase F0 subunit B [bacterium]
MYKKIITSALLVGFTGIVFASGGGEDGSFLSAYLSPEMTDFLFKVINFVILIFLLHKFARKPIAKMLSSSAENTKNEVDTALVELENAKKKLAEYQEKTANLEEELEEREKASMAAIDIEKKQLIEDAELQAKKLEEQSLARVEQEIQKAKTEIREFLVNESIKMAEKTISSQIGSKEQKALIENYTKFLQETA